MWLPLTCTLLGTWPTTQACALTGNQTGNLLVGRPVLNPLSHSSQGWALFLAVKQEDNSVLLGCCWCPQNRASTEPK